MAIIRTFLRDPCFVFHYQQSAWCAVGTQGDSVNHEEVEDGLVSVAVPVFNCAGVVVAALNASTGSARADEAGLNGELVRSSRRWRAN